MFLNKKTLEQKTKFYPSYGMNRWDELTYILQSKSKGLKVAVLNHYLYHEANSTKNNKNKKMSSVSYQIEKTIGKTYKKDLSILKS